MPLPAGAGRIDFGCCCPVAFSAGVSSLGLSACATKKKRVNFVNFAPDCLEDAASFRFCAPLL